MVHGWYTLSIWSELGISGGTAVIILVALYFIVKWAVKNGTKEAWEEIRGKKRTWEEVQGEDDQF